jgi:hypothetical protein
MKELDSIHGGQGYHWVGDGFPVRTLFSYDQLGNRISPFLMLDYAGPMRFEPAAQPRGVGPHPHRGFETVTVVLQGEVEHRDSTGAGGRIGPGDVQWMTAAAGILHQEFHSQTFTRSGGMLEMVQLWVNLPARDKAAAPAYQTLLDRDIPAVPLAGDAGQVRVIAGEFLGRRGPARTFTPMQVWDVRLAPGRRAQLPLADGHPAALAVLHGSLQLGDDRRAGPAQLALFARAGTGVAAQAQDDGGARFMLLCGEPIDEPIAGYGPFVMNTSAEIAQALQDYRSGRFGEVPAAQQG